MLGNNKKNILCVLSPDGFFFLLPIRGFSTLSLRAELLNNVPLMLSTQLFQVAQEAA